MELSSDENHLDSFTKAKMAGLERFAKEFVTISRMKARKTNIDRQRKLAASERIFSMRFLFVQRMPAKEKAWVAKGLRKVMSHDDWSSSCIIRIERDHVLSSTQLYLILT